MRLASVWEFVRRVVLKIAGTGIVYKCSIILGGKIIVTKLEQGIGRYRCIKIPFVAGPVVQVVYYVT